MKTVLGLTLGIGALAIILALAAFMGSKTLDIKVQDQRHFSNAYTEFINLLAITQEMRRREKDYFLRKDAIYAKQYVKLSNEAISHLEELKTTQVDKSADIEKMIDLLKSHRREFLYAVATQETIGVDLDKGIQGKMRDNIHNLEDIIVGKIKSDKLTILLFTIRRNEKNFLLNMQSAPNQTTPEVASELQAALKSLPMKPDLRKSALLELEKYLIQFKALVAKENALRDSTAKLTSTFNAFENIHFELLKQTRAKSKDSYVALREYTQGYQVAVMGLGILTVIAAAIVAFMSIQLLRRNRED